MSVFTLEPKEQPPAMLLDVNAWLTGDDVTSMTFEEKGVYIDLIARSWTKVGIPADPKKIQRLLGMTKEDFDRVWPVVSEKFVTMSDRPDDRLFNPRAERTRQEFFENKAVNSARARKASNARWHPEEAAA